MVNLPESVAAQHPAPAEYLSDQYRARAAWGLEVGTVSSRQASKKKNELNRTKPNRLRIESNSIWTNFSREYFACVVSVFVVNRTITIESASHVNSSRNVSIVVIDSPMTIESSPSIYTPKRVSRLVNQWCPLPYRL